MTVHSVYLLALLSLLAGLILLLGPARSWPWTDRVRAFLVPPLLLLCIPHTFVRIFYADRDIWNEIRLARTFGLYSGIPLYPGRDATGPILGTLHNPLSHILYWPATFAGSPVTAVRAGLSISVLLILLALVSTHRWAQNSYGSTPDVTRATRYGGMLLALQLVFALELFWLGALDSNIVTSIFHIHADPVALACGTLAGGLLLERPVPTRRLVVSALFAILAVAAKQTFAPLAVALGIFLYIADGSRTLLRYGIYLAGWAVLVAAAILAIFRPAKNLLFNVWTLASHRPPQLSGLYLPRLHDGFHSICNRLYEFARLDLQEPDKRAFAGFLLLSCVWAFLLLRWPAASSRRSLRQIVSENRWLVFILIALVLFPVLFKASITFGGSLNQLGVADFFLLLGLTTSLLQLTRSSRSPQANPLPHLIVFALVLLLSYRSFYHFSGSVVFPRSLTSEAWDFSRAHPGVAYFPCNPLSSYYADHHLYTVDHAIDDREVAGYPVPPAQFATGLPPGATLIAIDPMFMRWGHASQALLHYLSPDWTLQADPELTDFAVYRRSKPLHGIPFSGTTVNSVQK